MISYIEFSERLARGELKNTSAVEQTNLGEICPEYVDSILSLTNRALVDLSTRFPLVKRQIDLIFQENVFMYPLAEAGVTSGYLDPSMTEPFVDDDFIRVLNVWDADGLSHAVDTNGHIMAPTYNVLRFTKAKMKSLGEKVRIRYQSKYPTITVADGIDIPPNLETALQLLVASLYISHMNSPEHTAKGDSYYAAYLRHVGEDESRNLSSTSEVAEDTRFQDRGFV